MKTKNSQSGKSKSATGKSVRLNSENAKWLEDLLNAANKNRDCGLLKPNDVVNLLKANVTIEQLATIKKKPTDYQKQIADLRRIYQRDVAPISKNDFYGLLLTDEFADFRKRHLPKISGEIATSESA